MPNQFWAEVITNEEVSDNFWLIGLKQQELARESKPGQFLHIKVSPGLTPLLRRPISIHDVEKDEIKLLYQVVGEGTKLLTTFKTGDQIDVMGPLGNGFTLIEGTEAQRPEIAVVAGGIGVAPLLYLVKRLIQKGNRVTVYQGARSKELLLGQETFKALGVSYKIATDDGSAGQQGFVTELLEKDLQSQNFSQIYSCGPKIMLELVARLSKGYKVPAQLSLEERMGCGTGACLACVCKIKTMSAEQTQFSYKKVCVDGPVFKAEEVVFDD